MKRSIQWGISLGLVGYLILLLIQLEVQNEVQNSPQNRWLFTGWLIPTNWLVIAGLILYLISCVAIWQMGRNERWQRRQGLAVMVSFVVSSLLHISYLDGLWMWPLYFFSLLLLLYTNRRLFWSISWIALFSATYIGIQWMKTSEIQAEGPFIDVWVLGLGLFLCSFSALYVVRLRKQNWQLALYNQVLEKKSQEYMEEIKRHLETVESLSVRDYLTGLYNLKGFQHLLKTKLTETLHVDLYLLDIVSFIEFNAYEGEHAGDRFLCEVAKGLQREIPRMSLLARYDGDQFAVAIFYSEKPQEAERQTMREKIKQVVREANPGKKEVSYCIGFASYPEKSKTWQELIWEAERDLYTHQRKLKFQQEEIRRLKERYSTVGQIAASMAHEIRNPLTSVRGFVQLAARLSKEMAKWEALILPEIDRIDDLLKHLLDIADAQSEKPRLTLVNDMILNTLVVIQPEALRRGKKLTAQIPDLPVYAWLASRQIQQVLIQLIRNGLDAVEQKGSEVCVTLNVDQGRVDLCVTDDGIGMRNEQIERIFEPFFSLKEEQKGLGLSLAKQIISEHNGEILIESQEGKGTRVHLLLPHEASMNHSLA